MRKISICAVLGLSLMLAACGRKPADNNYDTQTEQDTQTAAEPAWREGKSYSAYDVSDKNGARKLWVDFGAETAVVYEDDGTTMAELNYGAVADLEYAKSGLKIQIMTDTLIYQCRMSRIYSEAIHTIGFIIL